MFLATPLPPLFHLFFVLHSGLRRYLRTIASANIKLASPQMLCRPLFVASLGNPPPAYRNTLHSAGHTLLSSLQQYLAYPPFTKSRPHANGLISQGENCTLWQSPSLMNLSGPVLATAWKAFLKALPSEDRSNAKLVVVHDELESPLGKIKAKHGGSAKGHNGLKSVTDSFAGKSYTRIGVGIGRPDSRESRDVVGHVMRKMTPLEFQKISDGVVALSENLVQIRDGRV